MPLLTWRESPADLTFRGNRFIIQQVLLASQRGFIREIPYSEVKRRLYQLLDDVERGKTIVITRHGRPVADLAPAPARDKGRIERALDRIAARRRLTGEVTLNELLAWRHEGHNC